MAGKTNYEKIRKQFLDRQKQLAEMDGDDKWWKPGMPQDTKTTLKHRVRILPPPDGFDSWFVEYAVHYRLKNDAGEFLTITCPQKTLKKPCPVCEFTKGLWKSGKPEDQKIARDIGAKTRYCSNVLVLSEDAKVPKLWSYGAKVWSPINEMCFGTSGEFVPIDDPQNGFNLNIAVGMNATESGNFPEYTVTPEMRSSPIPDKTILDRLHPMHEMIQGRVKSYDEIRSILLGGNAPKVEVDHTTPAGEVTEPVDTDPAPTTPTVVDETPAPVTQKSAPKTEEKTNAEAAAASSPSREELVKRARAALQKRSGAAAQ